ncbi:hypothetical protein ACVOMV_19730 [Mesorhizobium atlanticum]
MTEKSAAELEREAEATRARVVATADSIRDKMTPGQLFDEFTGLFRNGTGSDMLQNLKVQMRDNPLPLTVIGAGLAWLMLGSGASPASAGADGATRRGPGLDHGAFGAGMSSTASDAADSVAEAASGAAAAVSGMASEAAGTVSDMASSAADTLCKLGGSYGRHGDERRPVRAQSASGPASRRGRRRPRHRSCYRRHAAPHGRRG